MSKNVYRKLCDKTFEFSAKTLSIPSSTIVEYWSAKTPLGIFDIYIYKSDFENKTERWQYVAPSNPYINEGGRVISGIGSFDQCREELQKIYESRLYEMLLPTV